MLVLDAMSRPQDPPVRNAKMTLPDDGIMDASLKKVAIPSFKEVPSVSAHTGCASWGTG